MTSQNSNPGGAPGDDGDNDGSTSEGLGLNTLELLPLGLAS